MRHQLAAESQIGRSWQAVRRSAEGITRPTADATTRLWEIKGRRILDCATEGPLIYMVIGHKTVQYVGQTSQPLTERFRTHLADPLKAQRWALVAALPLVHDVPMHRVNELERVARNLLRPKMGRAWPRQSFATKL